MPPEAYIAGADALKGVSTWIQVAWTIAVGALVLIGLYMTKLAREGKALAVKNQEVIAEKEKAEAERTARRKTERDKQLSDMEHRQNMASQELSKRIDSVEFVAKGVGNSLDRHVEEHKVNDEKTQKSIESIDTRLRKIEANLIERKEFIDLCNKVNDINTNVVRMITIYEERAKHDIVK